MTRAYFVVEGPHDVEVIGRLCATRGARRVRWEADLDPAWAPLIPRDFPFGGDLLKRVPVPIFFQSEAHSVAVHAAQGDSRIADTLQESLFALDERPDAVGVLLDADDKGTPAERYAGLTRRLAPISGLPSAPGAPGEIAAGPPRFGVFVLPDNAAVGTMEDVLLACAREAYPRLLEGASSFVDPLDPHDETLFVGREEWGDLRKAAGKKKAVVASIGAVLRPGKAIQTSIQDNRWLRHPAALALPEVRALQGFIDALLGLPA